MYRRDRTRNTSKRAAADPHLVPRAQFMVWHKDGVTLAVGINWGAGVGDVTMDPATSLCNNKGFEDGCSGHKL